MVLDTKRGHGRLGIRGAMRTFDELVALPVYEKRVAIEARPAVLVVNWTLDQGDTYQAVFDQPFLDSRLDVLAVITSIDAGLTRVETLDECRATPGTYFYDFLEVPPATIPLWDDGVTQFDDGVTQWDPFSVLYVHLFDGSDPNFVEVTAKVGIHIASKGLVEPTFSDEKNVNGGFEDGLTNWSLLGGGAATVSLETIAPIEGFQSLRWDLSATANNFKVARYDPGIDVVRGEVYRVSGLYLIDQKIDPTARLRVEVIASGGNYIQEDGRNLSTSIPATELFDTGEKVRRFIFDFVAPETGNLTLQFVGQGVPSTAGIPLFDDGSTVWDGVGALWDDFGIGFPTILLDAVSVKRIWRFNYHEHKVSPTAVPEVQTGSRDIFFTAQQIGTGGIDFVNGEGFFESLVALFAFESHELFIRVGGAFADGEELLIDDYRTRFKAVMRRDQVDDVRATFDLEDVRSFILQTIPPNTFTLPEFPDLDPAEEGKLRAVWFGPVFNITPVRIDLTGNGYGVYELADPTIVPNGITSIDNLYSYADGAAAAAKDSARRKTLALGVDYSEDLLNARFTLLQDVQIIEITSENNAIDWSQTGGGTPILSGFIPPGLYMPHELANAITTVLNAQGGADKSCAYNQTTHDFTLTRAAPSFNLHLGDGPNKGNAIWSTIGFTGSANLTGLLSYTGDTAIYTDPETDHILRADGVGARDTVPVPRFTGTSGDPVQIGADITRALWELFLDQQADLIDEPSFLDARTTAPQPLGIYIRKSEDVKSIFQKIQNSNRSNIVIDGEGVIRFIVNQPGAQPPDTPSLDDSDYISWNMRQQIDEVFGTIRIFYAEDATTGAFITREVKDENTEQLYSRTGAKDFTTYLVESDDALGIANLFLALASNPQRLAEFTIKGFVELVEGQKLLLTRERAIDTTEQLSDELFRVLQVRSGPLSAQTQILAVEDV